MLLCSQGLAVVVARYLVRATHGPVLGAPHGTFFRQDKLLRESLGTAGGLDWIQERLQHLYVRSILQKKKEKRF